MTEAALPTDAQRRTADQLFAARRDGRAIERLDPAVRPRSVEEALAVQRAVTSMMIAAGERVGGWKCSAPHEQRPVSCAPIFASTIQRGSICRLLPRAGQAPVEPEIAFLFGRDLPPRDEPYTEAEIRAAISETHLVLELIASRYAEPMACTFPEQLADHVSNQGLLVGPGVSRAPEAAPPQLALEIATPGDRVERAGRHPDNNPLLPVYWLANFLAASGNSIKAGQIVTTGSYAGVIDVPLDQPIHIRFGELGTIEAVFEATRKP